MSKIKFNQISKDQLEVVLAQDTPMDIVYELSKSLISKGLVEDLSKSTVSCRYFYKPKDKANDLADKLIKSLEDMSGLSKAKKLPWWTDNQGDVDKINQQQERLRIEDRARVAGIKRPAAAPAAPAIPNTLPGVPNKIHDPEIPGKIDYHKKPEEMHKEDDPSCKCEKCNMEKSGYGPKGGGQYSVADNVRRKMVNTGEQTGFGSNVNIKRYTTAKYDNTTPQTDPKLKRSQAEENKKQGLIKAWANHLPFPNAEEEMAKIAAAQRVINDEDAMANQLARMMRSKAMLSGHRQPTSEDMIMAGEQMGIGVSEQVIKSQDQRWNNSINNWLAEAAKPISQRFASEEEEIAYWNSIKVVDKDDGSSGY